MSSLFELAKQHEHKFKVITIIIPIFTAVVGLLLTVTDKLVGAPPDGNIPQIHATTVSDFQAELEARKSRLQSEIDNIDDLLADIANTQMLAEGKPLPAEPTEGGKDFFLISGVKTLAIYFLLVFTSGFSILFLIADLIGLLFGYDFDILRVVWDFSWNTATINWYWDRADTVGIVTGFLIIMLTAIPSIILENRAKKQESEDAGQGEQPQDAEKPVTS